MRVKSGPLEVDLRPPAVYFFFMKNQCCHARIGQKSVNSVKTILDYGPKKSIEDQKGQ